MTKLLLVILSAVFIIGQFGRIPIGADVTLHLNDIAAGILGGLGVLGAVRAKIKPRLTKPILLFAGVSLFSLLINSPRYQFREIIIAFSYWLRWVAYAGLYFYFVRGGKNWGEKWPVFLTAGGVLTALGGYLQYFLFPDLNNLSFINWDPHYYRLVGTFLDPGFTGAVLVLSLIIITFKCQMSNVKCQNHNSKIKNVLIIGLWVFVYSALALTYSRASYLMYFISMSLIAFFNKSLKFWLFVVVLGVVTIAILPRPGGAGTQLERRETAVSRISNWKASTEIFLKNPVFGVGFNAYRYAQRDYGYLDEKWQETHSGAGADNSFLFIAATTGVIGTASYFWLGLKIIGNIKEIGGNKHKVILFASLIGLFVHSFFTNTLFYPWIMEWVWVLLAVTENELNLA